MDLNDILAIRLFNQQITGNRFQTAKEIVSWMGAMQAQDFPMAKWAIGLRLPDVTDQAIETAFNKGEIIRIHLLRPTWHFVSADDTFWMLELTAPRIKASLKSRQKQLGLTVTILSKSNNIIEKALANGNFLTRNKLKTKFENMKIATDGNRLSHLMMHAEMEGLVCSGPIKGKQQTYALLEERAPKKETFIKEEALGKLAQRYFTSHSPATFRDFVWWSGLTVADARHALELVKDELVSDKIEDQIYWLNSSFSLPQKNLDSIHLLPAFDEYLISYKDRSAMLHFEDHKSKVSFYGVFRPIIVVNGVVAGIWKRTIKKDKVVVETSFFQETQNNQIDLVEKAVKAFGDFLEKETTINHNTI
jgi:hypothetical protein